MEINHYPKKVFHSYHTNFWLWPSNYQRKAENYLNFTNQCNSGLNQMPWGILSYSISSAVRLQITHIDGVCIVPHIHSWEVCQRQETTDWNCRIKSQLSKSPEEQAYLDVPVRIHILKRNSFLGQWCCGVCMIYLNTFKIKSLLYTMTIPKGFYCLFLSPWFFCLWTGFHNDKMENDCPPAIDLGLLIIFLYESF